jgi:drug/metabolite transporter (DMT)-like permease
LRIRTLKEITMTSNTARGKNPTEAAFGSASVSTGLFMMFAAVMISPIIDIFAKLAITTVPAIEISAARFLIQSLAAVPFLLVRRHLFTLSWRSTGFHIVRGGILALSMVSFVATLEFMEVADAIAIFFVEPIILTILSSIFLKEAIGWRRYTACAVGFCGALLVIQPSFAEVGYVALLPVVSAFCIAIFAILTRIGSQKEDPWSMQLQSGFWGFVFCALSMVFSDVLGMPGMTFASADATILLYLLGVGVSATLSGILGVYAYRAAPASMLAPLQYLEIVSATIFGWLVFNHFPDALKWLGIAIIVASGLYIIWRERRFASKPVSNVETTPLTP